jgi:hypothetical protein
LGGQKPPFPSSERKEFKHPKSMLSDKERTELLAAGKCFKCRESGHLARQCPQGVFVKLDKSGRAPGMSTFNINTDLDAIERLRDLAETTEDVHEIPCGAISFNSHAFPQLECLSIADVGGFPQVGDLVAEIAAWQLQSVLFYPGDLERLPEDQDADSGHRFWLV